MDGLGGDALRTGLVDAMARGRRGPQMTFFDAVRRRIAYSFNWSCVHPVRGARESVSPSPCDAAEEVRCCHQMKNARNIGSPRRDAALRPLPHPRDGRLHSCVVTCCGLALCRWLHRHRRCDQPRGGLQLRLGRKGKSQSGMMQARGRGCSQNDRRLLTHLLGSSLRSSLGGSQLSQLSFAQLRRRSRLGAGQGCVGIRPPLGG